jgi:hypothetical protein
MDDIRQIAISKIADILSNSYLIIPQADIWKKIFNNAGLSDIYNDKECELREKREFNYNNVEYHHNGNCYSALNEILLILELGKEQDKFLSLLNSIADKICISNLFDDTILKRMRDSYIFDIEQYLQKKDLEERNNLLKSYPSKEFKILRSNVNILNLDLQFTYDGLKVLPFSNRVVKCSFDNNILIHWLSKNYPNIKESYINAIKSYSTEDKVGCIVHCRNVITGIFTINKQEKTKWMDGLKKACNKDKNINNVDANKIHKINYNINSSNINERYQYPRYNLIYRLYTFTCALGAHVNEGNKILNSIDNEVTTMEDAFMALRMTEDVLIWLYQTNGIIKLNDK